MRPFRGKGRPSPSYCRVPENAALRPWHKGVFRLQDAVPVIVPLATVPVPVNSTKPVLLAWTPSMVNVAFSGTGLAGTPIRTPTPVLFAEGSNPFPEMEPCPLLLFATKQTGPSTEHAPTGLVTLHGLETNVTW